MVLPILPLSQRDSRWSNQRLGTVNSTTIGSHGCVITSMSMLSTYYGHPILPNQIDDTLTDRGLYFDGNLFVNDSITKIFSDIKFDKVAWCETVPAPIAEIKKYLDAKKPVVVSLINQGIRHYVLAVGYEGNQIIVNDPWQGDQVNILDRWGDSASKILQVNFFSGPVPSSTQPVIPSTASSDSVLATTDQSRINLGTELGVLEVQAIRSEILDLRRIRRSLEQDLTNANLRIVDLENHANQVGGQREINDLTMLDLGSIGRLNLGDVKNRIANLINENNNLNKQLNEARQEIENLEVEIDNKDETLPQTGQEQQHDTTTFTDRLKSRKLILSVAASLIALINSKFNLGLSVEQLLVVIGPLMGFVGVEGLADTVERMGTPTTKVTIKK